MLIFPVHLIVGPLFPSTSSYILPLSMLIDRKLAQTLIFCSQEKLCHVKFWTLQLGQYNEDVIHGLLAAESGQTWYPGMVGIGYSEGQRWFLLHGLWSYHSIRSLNMAAYGMYSQVWKSCLGQWLSVMSASMTGHSLALSFYPTIYSTKLKPFFFTLNQNVTFQK